MRIEEAMLVGKAVRALICEPGAVVLNLGSGTRAFREIEQPHIEQHIFSPAREAGAQIVHADLKADIGVDVHGDLEDPAVVKKLKDLHPNIILACNLLEHVPLRLRRTFPRIIDDILEAGGHLILTVPRSYPRHLDPIDTYFRPSPDELAGMFDAYAALDRGIIASTTYFQHLLESPPGELALEGLRLLAPFYKPRSWVCRVHRFLWWRRPYLISFVLLRKPSRTSQLDE